MGFRMSVPYLGLTRNPAESGKHKAHGLPICKEAGYERASASRTLDRTLSDQNTYVGYRSGEELWGYLEERANNYRMQVPGKDKANNPVMRERGLRKDAIVGFAVIWKPPAEVIRDWDRDTRERFFSDCHAVAEELEPELFAPSNILMRSRHCDEVRHGGEEHEHDVGIPLTADGRYNGSDMLNHMRRNFNANFAAKMRERGWDMDDLELYDPERAKVDEEYAARRQERRRSYGKSVNDYAADEAARAAEEATKVRIAQEEATAAALQRQLTAMQATAKEAVARDIAVAERVDAEAARDAAREDELEARQRQSSADRSAAAVRRQQAKAERAAADAREQAAREMEQARARSQQMMIAARNDAEAYCAYVFEEAEREADLRVDDASLVADTLSGDAATILDDFAARRSEALEAIADARTAAERFADEHSHSRYVDMIVSFIERVPDLVEHHFPDRAGSFRRFWEGTVARIAGTFADEFVRTYDPEPERHEPDLDGFVAASELSAKRLSQVDLDAMQAMVDEVRAMAAARPNRPHKTSGHGASKSRIRVQQQAQRSRNRQRGSQLGS